MNNIFRCIKCNKISGREYWLMDINILTSFFKHPLIASGLHDQPEV